MANFTLEQIQLLSAIKDHEQLKKQVNIMLDNCSTMHPVRVTILRQNVMRSKTVANTIGLMWNMLLSGEGLSVKSSRYQKNNKEFSRRVDKK